MQNIEVRFGEDSTTQEGRERILRTIIHNTVDFGGKKNDQICWDYYNNKQDPNKFNYLRKVGNFEFPAKVRRIPKQRPYIDNLVSQQSQRPFAFSVYSVDDESISKKYDEKIRSMIGMAEEKAAQAYYMLTGQLQSLEQQRQQLMGQLQQQSRNEEEQAQQQQLQQQLPQITSQLDFLKRQITQAQSVSQDDMDKQEEFFKYKYKDVSEIIAQKSMRFLRQDLNVAYKEVQGIKHRCVTGKEYLYVNYTIGNKLPDFEVLNEQKVYLPISDIVYNAQDGPWVRIEEGLSYDQIL